MKTMLFRNYGGIYQLRIADAEDLAIIQDLDPALWAATSAPLGDLRCDGAFLAYLDAQGKGRIRTNDILAARDWLFRRLANRGRLPQAIETLYLDDLDSNSSEGRGLKQAAQHVLEQVRPTEAQVLTLAQLRHYRSSYQQLLANGDGIICPEVVQEPVLAQFIGDMLATVGGAPDLSGRMGVGKAHLATFLAQGRAYLAWKAQGQNGPDGALPAVLPWGLETAAAADLIGRLDPKIEQYFWQCELLGLQPAAGVRLLLGDEQLKQLDVSDAAAIRKELAEAPLAPPRPDGQLLLQGSINPLFRRELAQLQSQVLPRALGAAPLSLTRESWALVKAVFQPYWTWQGARPAAPFERLPEGRLRDCLDGQDKVRLEKLIQLDVDAAPELQLLADLEKLILFQRWLLELANNFVNFAALYDPRERALFERGTLVIDGRRLEFAVRVSDRPAHRKIAAESKMFLLYVAISDKGDKNVLFEVAAPVTSGERGRLAPGKRGVFYDVGGQVYDALVLEVVENPISLWEAIKAPFRRFASFIAKKVEDLATARAQASEAALTTGLDKAAKDLTAAPAGAAGAPEARRGGAPELMSLLAGGGLALAALGSALAYAVATLAKIRLIDIVLTIGSIVVAVLLFSALLGYLKLRRRDMSSLLEANGWAINMHMRLTTRLGQLFTRTPALPVSALQDRLDTITKLLPRQERPRRWQSIALLVVLLAVLAAAGFALYYHFRTGVWPGWPWSFENPPRPLPAATQPTGG